MHIFILGMGHVGKALAANLRASGHTITGSTTTPEKVAELQEHAEEVVVLRGSETEKLVAAASGCDVIVVTVAPNVKNTRTVEERHKHYADVLVASCASARQACERVIFLSSFPSTVTAAPATNPYPRQRQPVTARSPPHAITRKPNSRC